MNLEDRAREFREKGGILTHRDWVPKPREWSDALVAYVMGQVAREERKRCAEALWQ